MKQIVLNIPDNKYPFFMELVNSLGFTKLSKVQTLSKEKQKIIDELKDSLEQVELHLQGKIKLKSAEQLLNEL